MPEAPQPSASQPTDHVSLPEAEARSLLLIRAIESTDPPGRFIGEAERVQAEQAALQALPGRGMPLDARQYLPARAQALLRIAQARNATIARLSARDPWWDRLAWLLPLFALVSGFLSDRIFNAQRTDLLSLPLLGVAVWNLAVYAWLAIAFVRRQRGRAPAHEVERTIVEMPGWFSRRAAARLRESVAAAFHRLWWKAAAPLETARLHRTLHLAAAAWALGVVLSILVTGVSTKFRVGWESTWLSPTQVHAVLRVMQIPAAPLGVAPFTLEEVQRLEFTPTSAPGQPEARKWALIYIVFIAAAVVIPRLALWLWARRRVRVLASRIAVDISDPYFARVMARVSPARIGIRLIASDPLLARAVTAVLRQAGEPQAVPDPAAPAAPLVTPQGDRLTIVQADEPADFTWIAVASDSDPALDAIQAVPPALVLPTLLLLGPDARASAVERACVERGIRAEVLGLAACAACWPLEVPLREWIRRHASGGKEPGVERLTDAWAQHHAARWTAAMQRVASVLTDSAADGESVKGFLPGADDRRFATAVLLGRLQARLDALHTDLLALHAAEAEAWQHGMAHDAMRDRLREGGAGAAGALAGALAGAKVDLLTGGLTLGAGMAIGALLGGAGVFTAARWWIMGGTVRLRDEQLQALAESLVMQYLAVVHAGRVLDREGEGIPPGWKTAAHEALAPEAGELQRIARAARAGDTTAAGRDMTSLMRRATRAAILALHGSDRAEVPAE